MQAIEPGFRPDGVLTLRTTLPMPKDEPTARRVQFYEQVLSGIRELPGVTGAAHTSFLPLVMGGGIWRVRVPGQQPARGAPESASLRFVSPGYFDAMGIPRRLGRDVGDADGREAPYVAVVSESFAVLALVLSATGIHAVLSFLVAGRRREIGVRLALGAPRRRILRMVVGEAMALAGTGIVLGLAAALGMGRLLQALLVGVDAGNLAASGAAISSTVVRARPWSAALGTSAHAAVSDSTLQPRRPRTRDE